jgi:hypothetical protein
MSTTGRMTGRLAAGSARRPRIVGFVRATARKLSDHVHGAADDRARALGWEVTQTPGRFGLSGRSYRDPRFAARRQDRQDGHAGTNARHE